MLASEAGQVTEGGFLFDVVTDNSKEQVGYEGTPNFKREILFKLFEEQLYLPKHFVKCS